MINNLPTEMICNIIRYLDYKTLKLLCKNRHYYNEYISNEILYNFIYHIQNMNIMFCEGHICHKTTIFGKICKWA